MKKKKLLVRTDNYLVRSSNYLDQTSSDQNASSEQGELI